METHSALPKSAASPAAAARQEGAAAAAAAEARGCRSWPWGSPCRRPPWAGPRPAGGRVEGPRLAAGPSLAERPSLAAGPPQVVAAAVAGACLPCSRKRMERLQRLGCRQRTRPLRARPLPFPLPTLLPGTPAGQGTAAAAELLAAVAAAAAHSLRTRSA
eukprot:355485-Chlamydomonas_euryale.AAC.7